MTGAALRLRVTEWWGRRGTAIRLPGPLALGLALLLAVSGFWMLSDGMLNAALAVRRIQSAQSDPPAPYGLFLKRVARVVRASHAMPRWVVVSEMASTQAELCRRVLQGLDQRAGAILIVHGTDASRPSAVSPCPAQAAARPAGVAADYLGVPRHELLGTQELSTAGFAVTDTSGRVMYSARTLGSLGQVGGVLALFGGPETPETSPRTRP